MDGHAAQDSKRARYIKSSRSCRDELVQKAITAIKDFFMMKKDVLTNEELATAFTDNFKLARYAIHLAQKEIHANKEVTCAVIIDRLRRDLASGILSYGHV